LSRCRVPDLAQGLFGGQQRLGLLVLVLLVAVGDLVLPVASLRLDVEVEARRAPDRLQTLR
jgi:hypothetical protein